MVGLERMPFGPNGKVDTDLLPAPTPSVAVSEQASRPAGAIESLIAEVWSEVLGVDGVSAGDNFFALGGHSLMAIRVVARLKKRMKLAIPMTAVFEHPELCALARHVEGEIRARIAARGASVS